MNRRCGSTIFFFNKTCFIKFVAVFLSVILLSGCTTKINAKEKSEIEDETNGYDYDLTSLGDMFEDLKNNSLRASNKYLNKHVEIVGRLANIDSDGKYFSVCDYNDDGFLPETIQCNITNDDVLDMLLLLNKGDIITVCGKITVVGEVLGFSMDAELIDGNLAEFRYWIDGSANSFTDFYRDRIISEQITGSLSSSFSSGLIIETWLCGNQGETYVFIQNNKISLLFFHMDFPEDWDGYNAIGFFNVIKEELITIYGNPTYDNNNSLSDIKMIAQYRTDKGLQTEWVLDKGIISMLMMNGMFELAFSNEYGKDVMIEFNN